MLENKAEREAYVSIVDGNGRNLILTVDCKELDRVS